MIKIPTVLILGAGSSVHCGYPLGQQLINQLSNLRLNKQYGFLPNEFDRKDVEDFLTRLSRAGHYSIDAFLEKIPDAARLGKFLIASQIKQQENIDNLFPPRDSGWYQYLFNSLLDKGEPNFEGNALKIITFNYDRSLEAYLHHALQARFSLNRDDAAAILQQLPIVHVHGVLGKYPAVPYEVSADPEELLEISEQISIIHEMNDGDGEFCNEQFRIANSYLKAAERIYFLGFGFHPDNVRRLNFFRPENIQGKLVRGVVASLEQIARQRLLKALEFNGITSEMIDPWECNIFFERAATLE